MAPEGSSMLKSSTRGIPTLGYRRSQVSSHSDSTILLEPYPSLDISSRQLVRRRSRRLDESLQSAVLRSRVSFRHSGGSSGRTAATSVWPGLGVWISDFLKYGFKSSHPQPVAPRSDSHLRALRVSTGGDRYRRRAASSRGGSPQASSAGRSAHFMNSK